MRDSECIAFLQWALTHLRLRWPGFRKVRGQVCKRIQRRIRALQLCDTNAYRTCLQGHASEWEVLDGLCRITISRFYRDQGVFDCLGQEALPVLAHQAVGRGNSTLRCWCAGCASGEEAYTLALLWNLVVQPIFPELDLRIIATDIDEALLKRARQACYSRSSLKDLPEGWLEQAFIRSGHEYCLQSEFRTPVHFVTQDIRRDIPIGPFDLVLCRNVVFTYFDYALQQDILARIRSHLLTGGALVIGCHESLPSATSDFPPWFRRGAIYRYSEPAPGRAH